MCNNIHGPKCQAYIENKYTLQGKNEGPYKITNFESRLFVNRGKVSSSLTLVFL
jgi:hypothetical protein